MYRTREIETVPMQYMSCDIYTHIPAQKEIYKLHTVPIC